MLRTFPTHLSAGFSTSSTSRASSSPHLSCLSRPPPSLKAVLFRIITCLLLRLPCSPYIDSVVGVMHTGHSCYCYFREKETVAQQDSMICPRSRYQEVAESRFQNSINGGWGCSLNRCILLPFME